VFLPQVSDVAGLPQVRVTVIIHDFIDPAKTKAAPREQPFGEERNSHSPAREFSYTLGARSASTESQLAGFGQRVKHNPAGPSLQSLLASNLALPAFLRRVTHLSPLQQALGVLQARGCARRSHAA